MGLLLLLLLRFLVHWHMHWGRFGIRMCVRVCVRRGGLSESSSDVEVVVSQVSGDDSV